MGMSTRALIRFRAPGCRPRWQGSMSTLPVRSHQRHSTQCAIRIAIAPVDVMRDIAPAIAAACRHTPAQRRLRGMAPHPHSKAAIILADKLKRRASIMTAQQGRLLRNAEAHLRRMAADFDRLQARLDDSRSADPEIVVDEDTAASIAREVDQGMAEMDAEVALKGQEGDDR